MHTSDPRWIGLRDSIQKHGIFRCDPNKVYTDAAPKGMIPGSSPGNYWTWVFVLKRCWSNGQTLVDAADLLLSSIRDHVPGDFQIGGMETGSIPIMAAISVIDPSVNWFSVKKERRDHGIFQIIDGSPTKSPVVFIDDIVASGSRLYNAIDVVHHELRLPIVPAAFSIVGKGLSDSMIFQGSGPKRDDPPVAMEIKLHSLFRLKDFHLKYRPEEYWFPEDCDKTVNKRPSYV